LPVVSTKYGWYGGYVTEFDDVGRDDDGNVIAETSNDSASTAATNGTSSGKTGSGKYRREISKVDNLLAKFCCCILLTEVVSVLCWFGDTNGIQSSKYSFQLSRKAFFQNE